MKFPSYNTLDIILLFISQQYTAKRLIETLTQHILNVSVENDYLNILYSF